MSGKTRLIDNNLRFSILWNTRTDPTYTCSFDAMSRPTGLTDQNNTTDVSGVSYNAANQLLGITYFGKNETRTYNTLNQMTNVTIGSTMNITYTFPAGTNNGKISSQMDAISGETVTYQYDSLNRLLSASSSKGWSETYRFDGFGNLLSKTPTGGAPTLSQAVNAATNRIVGQNYDANGNQTSSSTGTLTYDAENRVLTAASNGIQYAYDSRNKRIWSATIAGANMTQVLTYYGVDGQKLGTYTVLLGAAGPGPAVLMGTNAGTLAVFFGGKRIGVTSGGSTSAFTQDRLGSNGSYYPYGEAHGTVQQDQVGFATYTNDSATGLQYADQRYYASNWGRFMSPDPYTASAGPASPASWNRYSYVQGDPVNYGDRTGLFLSPAEQGSNGGTGGGSGSWEQPGGGGAGCAFGLEYSEDLTPCVPFPTFGVPIPTGGGGGSEGSYVQVKVPAGAHYTANQMQALNNGLNDAITHVMDTSTNCAAFFAGSTTAIPEANPAEIQAAVAALENTIYEVADVPYNAGAQTVTSTLVKINPTGAFFTTSAWPDGAVTVIMPKAAGVNTDFTFNSIATLQAFMMLHELGHQLNVFRPDKNAAVNGANSEAILNNCFTQNEQGEYH